MRALYLVLLLSACAHGGQRSAKERLNRVAAEVSAAEARDAQQARELAELRSKVEELVAAYEAAAADFALAADRHERARLLAERAADEFVQAKAAFESAERHFRWMGYAIMLASTLEVADMFCAGAQSTRSFRAEAGCSPLEDVDHVLAHARGGANHPWNYVCLDRSLNRSFRDGLWAKVQQMPLQLLRGAIASGLMKLRCADSEAAFGR